MARKGGYQILNLSTVDFEMEGPGTSDPYPIKKGTFNELKRNLKAVLVSGITINGTIIPDVFGSKTISANTVTISIMKSPAEMYYISVTNTDNVTIQVID